LGGRLGEEGSPSISKKKKKKKQTGHSKSRKASVPGIVKGKSANQKGRGFE